MRRAGQIFWHSSTWLSMNLHCPSCLPSGIVPRRSHTVLIIYRRLSSVFNEGLSWCLACRFLLSLLLLINRTWNDMLCALPGTYWTVVGHLSSHTRITGTNPRSSPQPPEIQVNRQRRPGAWRRGLTRASRWIWKLEVPVNPRPRLAKLVPPDIPPCIHLSMQKVPHTTQLRLMKL